MATVERAAEPYQTIRLERRDGILPRTFHTNGGPLQWGEAPHRECPEAFRDIGSAPDTTVVIMTGTGAAVSGPRPTPTDGCGLGSDRLGGHAPAAQPAGYRGTDDQCHQWAGTAPLRDTAVV